MMIDHEIIDQSIDHIVEQRDRSTKPVSHDFTDYPQIEKWKSSANLIYRRTISFFANTDNCQIKTLIVIVNTEHVQKNENNHKKIRLT